MRSRRVSDPANWRKLDALEWGSLTLETVPLMATPLAMQPTEYIRRSWEGRTWGTTPELSAASVHDGDTWLLRLQWSGVSPAGGDFPDGLAVALPVSGEPVLALMGAQDALIHYLRWTAGKPGLRSIVAGGIGQSRPGPELPCFAEARADGERWHLLLGRAMGSGGGRAALVAGQPTRIGFAVWHGANEERAGIKAFSIDWIELQLDP